MPPKRKTVPVTPPASSARNPNLGRQWVSVTPPTPPKKSYTPIPWDQVNQEVRGLPDVPGIPKDHPGNAHLTGLPWMQIERAHRIGQRHLEPHVNEQGEKCPQCYPPRKKRAV